MDKDKIKNSLRSFAEQHLDISKAGRFKHHFALYECPKCEAHSLRAVVERHKGDKPKDFEGILWTDCPRCQCEQMALGITQKGKKATPPDRVDRPACSCGNDTFYMGSLDQWEKPATFVKGTVVAMCTICDNILPLVDTDG